MGQFGVETDIPGLNEGEEGEQVEGEEEETEVHPVGDGEEEKEVDV